VTADRVSIRQGLADAPARAAVLAARAGDPPAGEWSAREVILHLAIVDELVWHPRLDSLLAGGTEPPRWGWVEPGLWSGPNDDTLVGALAAYRERRAATLARVDALGEAGWTRFGIHATFGRLDVPGLLRVLADHDAEHLAQLEGLAGR
jgi:DinB superfamily